MIRKFLTPTRFMEDVEKNLGFSFWNMPSTNNRNYFSDEVYYEFKEQTIERIYESTSTLHQMCLDYVDEIVSKGDYENLGLNNYMIAAVEDSYKNLKDSHVYGRFDLAYDIQSQSLKMLEYNADTPTSLYESSIVQWDWKEYYFPELDQYNSIHEELIKRWEKFPDNMYFTAHEIAGEEDWSTVLYLLDTYLKSHKNAKSIELSSIGLNSNNQFTDLEENIISDIFKLYPWEFMQEEEFIKYASNSNYIEPAWKILLSNKSLLPELYKRHKGHPLLLPSYYEKDFNKKGSYIKKPLFSREGANVSSTNSNDPRNLDYDKFSDSLYDSSGYIYQQEATITPQDGYTPVIGSWVVGDEPCGIGIREDIGFTRNTSVFIPHIFI